MTDETKDTLELVKYELMLIFLPDLGEEVINKEIEELNTHISTDGGGIFHRDIWGLRTFTYRIRKHDEGFYVVLNFTLPPGNIAELEKSLTINPSVIRHLIVKTPLNYTIKTLSEYQALAKEEELREQEAKKAEQEQKGLKMQKTKTAKIVTEEKKKAPVKKIEKIVDIKEEKVEVKKAVKKAPEKSRLEEVDQKLKNIIDDPDISL